MARLMPFRAVRYSPELELASVVAPPYDVIDDEERDRLAARHPNNAVRIDLPRDEDGVDRYEVARCLLRDWLAQGVLVTDEQPTFTLYRMSYEAEDGTTRHTTGVMGALELAEPGTDILPHEHTTPKARSDRLDMLRSCRANLSAIWGLSIAKGLTSLLPTDEEPSAHFFAEDGVEHTLWVVDDAQRCAEIERVVASAPVVIADGHHRYETSLAYRDEVAGEGIAPGSTATLAYIVELVEDELDVGAIHRIVGQGPGPAELLRALAGWFEPIGAPPVDRPVTDAMQEAGALCLVLPEGDVLLRPRSDRFVGVDDLDSARIDKALAAIGAVDVAFQHDVDGMRRAVASGAATAGVLLRPATVEQIRATANGGWRMPPKTTFFRPKPRTGLVFRRLD